MRIKELLALKGMRQQDLADAMGVSLSAVKQMVNADSLTTATVEKIAKAIGVPVWQIFASPQEVAADDFFAVVRRRGQTYTFSRECELREALGVWPTLGVDA